MKIKIIELLVRIANKEEVPKKIKYRNKIWEYTSTVKGKGYQYYSVLYQEWKTLQNLVYLEECLNDEVEIIEENKEIEKIKMYRDEEGDYFLSSKGKKIYVSCDEIDFVVDRFNELIDEINKMKEGK